MVHRFDGWLMARSGLGIKATLFFFLRMAAVLWVIVNVGNYVGTVLSPTGTVRHGDYGVYERAAEAANYRQTLYPVGDWAQDIMNFRYAPMFAEAFRVLYVLPFGTARMVWALASIAAYLLGMLVWYQVGRRAGFGDAGLLTMTFLLPVCFYPWSTVIFTGNVTLFLVLGSGLATLFLLRGEVIAAGIICAFVALIKPQYLFPMLLPLIWRNWRMLLGLAFSFTFFYLLINAVYVLLVGVPYGINMLQAYVSFLTRIGKDYPWHGTEAMFYLQNYGIKQTLLRYFGFQSWIDIATLFLQTFCVAVWLGFLRTVWKQYLNSDKRIAASVLVALSGGIVMGLMLAQYEEILIGGVMFAYFQAGASRRVRWLALPFLIYAGMDFFLHLAQWTKNDLFALNLSTPLILICAAVMLGCVALYLFENNVRETSG